MLDFLPTGSILFPPRFTEQTKVRAMIIKFHSKSDLPAPISLTLGFLPSQWLTFPDEATQHLPTFFIRATSAAHRCTKWLLMYAHTPNNCVLIAVDKAGRELAAAAAEQQQWCSADLSAVGLTHVTRRTKRGSLNREKKKRARRPL